MKDKFDELLEDLNLDDFDAKDATYQVWVLGYDENENITDFEVMVSESKDAESMVEYANNYVEEERYGTMEFPDEVKYIEVLVETVVDLEDYDENVGTLFSKIVKIKKKTIYKLNLLRYNIISEVNLW